MGTGHGSSTTVDELSAEEIRVVGALVEKEATVPDTYPMTLNGLRTACNQSSSRDPIVSYDELTVQRTLDSLKVRGFVRFVHAAHGARTTKFRHVLDEVLDLEPAELAVLSVLMLRGAQTSGELRTRAERQHPFESVAAVEETLRRLADRDVPLVARLERRPGQRDDRWTHLLGGAPTAPPTARPQPAPSHPSAAPASMTSGLSERVASLETRVAALEALLRDLGS